MTSLCSIDRDAQNLLEAASSGAALSVKVVTNIAANLIAFLAVLDFINAALSWLGNMVDIQGLSFQVQSPLPCGGGGVVLASGDCVWTPTEPRSTPVPAAPLALHLSSSAPTSCGQWPSWWAWPGRTARWWRSCWGWSCFWTSSWPIRGSPSTSSAALRALRSGSAPKSSGSPWVSPSPHCVRAWCSCPPAGLAETHGGGPQPPTSRCTGQQDSFRLHGHLSQGLSILASLIVQLVKILPECRRPGLYPWVGKSPWTRERLPTPVFWPGEFHELYSPWGCKDSDMSEWLLLHFTSLSLEDIRTPAVDRLQSFGLGPASASCLFCWKTSIIPATPTPKEWVWDSNKELRE